MTGRSGGGSKESSLRPIVAYFGHHKCASGYISDIMRGIADKLGWRVRNPYLADRLPLGFHRDERFSSRREADLESLAADPYEVLCHQNADVELVRALDKRGFRGFHVVRDPRDILVSGYFSHRYSHGVNPDVNPWLIEHRQRLEGLSTEEGLFCELEFSEPYLSRLGRWNYEDPNILETRFETLTVEPEVEFRRILGFVGVEIAPVGVASSIRRLTGRRTERGSISRPTISERYLRGLLEKNSFERRSGGRARGDEDHRSHFRKGKAGDWREHFTGDLKTAFKRAQGELVLSLGYEKDSDW